MADDSGLFRGSLMSSCVPGSCASSLTCWAESHLELESRFRIRSREIRGGGCAPVPCLTSIWQRRLRCWIIFSIAACPAGGGGSSWWGDASGQVEIPLPSAFHEGLGTIPLSQTTLPRRAAVPDSNGWRSSVLPPVILKPRNQPMAVRSRWASPWNTLLRLIRAL